MLLLKAASVALAFALGATSAWAQRAILKDGRVLEGKFTQIPKVAEDPLKNADPDALTPILLCDDELRRTMVPFARLAKFEQTPPGGNEIIRIQQPVANDGLRVGGVGPIIRITPFDEFGRRIYSMNTTRGPIDVVQGITEISPVYTRLRGLRGTTSFIWEQSIATSSIPRESLQRILAKSTDAKNVDDRLRLVRLLMQADRYRDAQAELAQVMADFPDEPAPKELIPHLRQVAARILLKEMLARKSAGQHRLAYAMLKNFPADGVAGNILQQVRQELEEYTTREKERLEVIERLAQLISSLKEPSQQATYAAAIKEIEAELSLNTLDRMAAFRRLEGDASLTTEQKLALAISGWLLGADDADVNVKVALSLVEARNQVRGYLVEADKLKRDVIYSRIAQQEGASPQLIAKLIAKMKPPVETPIATATDYYELEVAGPSGGSNYNYYVLLPLEYDPYRSYPAIVTLNGAGTSPLQQIDWWAGAPSDKGRLGQATRQGYIVIAPVWSKPHQTKYNASGEEHDAVLRSLRDACRRFAIDTNRVYLSGHSIGGDAAWEIGVSHPDLWAGIIPIVATSTKTTINHYTANAAALPMYFVAGELDGTRMQENSTDWDRYFVRNYDVTVVEFRGRGHEHFSDEILRLFDWMGRHEREFFPKEFTASTKRPWDNYFWWLELDGIPARSTALQIKGTISASNVVQVTAPGAPSVWLSPEMVDFTRPVNVMLKGRPLSKKPIQPDLRVLLDDVRTRGERQHPFWAKVEADAK